MKTYTIVNRTTGEVVEHLAHKGRPLTVDGQEIPDPTPVAPPVGYKKQPSMAEMIRDMVRSERLAQEAAAAGFETLEEADDFDTGDDDELRTIYEIGETEPVSELRRRMIEAEREASGQPGNPADGSAEGAEAREPKAPPRKAKKAAPEAPEPSPDPSENEG